MSNPFLLLSDSSSATTNPYTSSSSKPLSISNDSAIPSSIYKDILQSVLLCTVDEQPSTATIYLADLAVGLAENYDKNHIDQALFERLRMTDPSSQLLTPDNKKSNVRYDANIVTENRSLHYLAGCYQRLLRQRVSLINLPFDHMKSILLYRTISNWCWMILENSLSIIVKLRFVYQIFTKGKIYLNNGSNCYSIVKVDPSFGIKLMMISFSTSRKSTFTRIH